MGKTIACVMAGVLVVGVLTGCEGGGEEPLGMSTVTAEPTPEPTPTPTQTELPNEIGVVMDLSDPELGIVFEDVPDLEGDQADVYNAIALFEREYWRSLTTNEVSPVINMMVSAEILATFEQFTTANANDQAAVGGVFHVTISDIGVDGNIATVRTCDNYAEATIADINGTYTPEEAGFSPLLLESKLGRGPSDGQWTITSQEGIGAC